MIADILHNLTNSFPYFLCSGCASPGTYSLHFSKKKSGGLRPPNPPPGALPLDPAALGAAPPDPCRSSLGGAPRRLARGPTARRCSLRSQHNPPKLFGLDPSLGLYNARLLVNCSCELLSVGTTLQHCSSVIADPGCSPPPIVPVRLL